MYTEVKTQGFKPKGIGVVMEINNIPPIGAYQPMDSGGNDALKKALTQLQYNINKFQDGDHSIDVCKPLLEDCKALTKMKDNANLDTTIAYLQAVVYLGTSVDRDLKQDINQLGTDVDKWLKEC